MKNEIKVEEFRGDHNKLYLTVPQAMKYYATLYFEAKKRFKVRTTSILIVKGWIVGDELYLQTTPRRPRFVSGSVNVRPVWVAHALCFRRNRRVKA